MSCQLFVCATAFEPSAQEARELATRLAKWGPRAVVYDNSSALNARIVREACAEVGVRYLGGDGNRGTAGALNRLLQQASSEGAGWLLYFDQDSRMVGDFAAGIDALLGSVDDDVALIGCRIVQPNDAVVASKSAHAWHDARFVISSGSMMRARALLAVDGFDELLGLDLVDHDLCMRVRGHGLRIAVDERRSIRHEIGRDSRRVRLLGIRATRHPLWRRRDMWRNSVILVRRYASTAPIECARHMLGRIAETLIGAVTFRDVGFVTAALTGAREGLRAPVGLVGLSELEHPNPHRWQPPHQAT